MVLEVRGSNPYYLLYQINKGRKFKPIHWTSFSLVFHKIKSKIKFKNKVLLLEKLFTFKIKKNELQIFFDCRLQVFCLFVGHYY